MALNEKYRQKVEQLARLRLKGYAPARCAKEMNLSPSSLERITSTKEYQEIENDVREKLEVEMAVVLEKSPRAKTSVRHTMRSEMEDAVPEAMRILLDNLRQKGDLKAALEILDRDPERQFAKSRESGSKTTNVGVQVGVRIDSKALAQAVKDANETYELIERATRNKIGEA